MQMFVIVEDDTRNTTGKVKKEQDEEEYKDECRVLIGWFTIKELEDMCRNNR